MRVAAILLAASVLCAATASAEMDLKHAEVGHLANGLTVIMLEDHSFPLVSVQALYKSGSVAEVTGKTGLAHFLEHLAFRGSRNFPEARATELIYDAGGEWHGYTAMDQTTYFATMPRDGLDLLLRIEADRMAQVTIDPRSIEAERGAVITELHSYENDPESVLQDSVTRTALQAHPYGSPMAGYVSDVARLTADDARAYYESHYAPGNAVLAIAGDFNPSEARALVARDFAQVPPRTVAARNLTEEPPQSGERRVLLHGAIKSQFFRIAYPAPAASSSDFPAFLVLQQMLSGTPGINMHQDGWSGSRASTGSLLFGASSDVATWLPVTREPFLFHISGSIPVGSSEAALERALGARLAQVERLDARRLSAARAAVIGTLAEDVQTTEDAAHQLAFFEGVGALDQLLHLPELVKQVTAADVRRVARTYLRSDQRTVGWLVPGIAPRSRLGAGRPTNAAERPGISPTSSGAGAPELRRLPGGLPAVVQTSPLSDTVAVELLVSGRVSGGVAPDELAGFGTVIRSGPSGHLADLVEDALAQLKHPPTKAVPASEDPATRLQQIIKSLTAAPKPGAVEPLAIFVAGNVAPGDAFHVLAKKLRGTLAATLTPEPDPHAPAPELIRERIARPLAQGGIGYVVEGPRLASRDALAWRMLLYILTHDYSGRIGLSAIRDKGLVYHIYSAMRTDGSRTWATLWTGVDRDKADAFERELRAELARLATDLPSPDEVDGARNHLLGRDISAAQSNRELAAKLAQEFIATGGLRTHDELRAQLQRIGAADVARMAKAFSTGTVIRVDVAGAAP